jgi:hypothetical protein
MTDAAKAPLVGSAKTSALWDTMTALTTANDATTNSYII